MKEVLAVSPRSSLKDAMKASQQALQSVAALQDFEASRRASVAEEMIFKDSPLRNSRGAIDLLPLDILDLFRFIRIIIELSQIKSN